MQPVDNFGALGGRPAPVDKCAIYSRFIYSFCAGFRQLFHRVYTGPKDPSHGALPNLPTAAAALTTISITSSIYINVFFVKDFESALAQRPEKAAFLN